MGNIIELRRRIIMGGVIPESSIIPSGYEQISYITADGNQSLRTTYEPILGDEFHIRFKGVNGTIISAGAGTYQVVLIGGFSNTGWYCKFFSSSTYSVTPSYSSTTWYDLDINASGILTTNNKTFSCSPESELDGTAKNLWIAERRNSSTPYTGSISEFWIKNNGQYKMYLIPCIRKRDQIVGMYDTVSKTFFISAKNNFIAGV